MRLVSYKILILLLFAFSNQLFSQDLSSFSIDSLKYILKSDVTANEEYKAKVCLELSKNYIYKNLDSAEVYAQKGLEFSIKTRYKKGEAVYYIRKCKISEFSYDMDKAIGYGDKAINLYENLEKDRNYLVILNIQAYLHEKQGNIDKALELYLKGLKESKNLKNELFEAVFYNNLSGVYSIANHIDESIEYGIKAAELYKKIGQRRYHGSALLGVGNKYLKIEQFELAQKYFDDARIISLEFLDYSALQKIELNLGIIEHAKGNYKQTLKHYQKGLDFAEQLNDLDDYKASSVACMNENLGSIYKELKRYDESINMYQQAIDYGEKTNSNHILNHAYYDLFEIYSDLNNMDSAKYYIQKYLPVNDSINKETYNNQIDELMYASKLENEQLKHQSELEITNLSKKRQQLYFGVIALLLILGLIIVSFLGYVQKNRALKAKTSNDNLSLEKENLSLKLDKKERELTASVLNLVERNEFISRLTDDLKSISFNKEQASQIKEIIKSTTIHDSKKLWTEFELRYTQNNTTLFNKLNNLSPNLTANDKRLIALIMLNFSTKEISSITYQSSHSIKISRYRLRKKLGLSKNENLIQFLNNL